MHEQIGFWQQCCDGVQSAASQQRILEQALTPVVHHNGGLWRQRGRHKSLDPLTRHCRDFESPGHPTLHRTLLCYHEP